MSDWIPSQVGLRNHPKTKRAMRLLGVRVSELMGCLHCLWWWALTYAPDGDLEDFDVEDLADAADWPGDAQALIDALVNCGIKGGKGFLERLDGRLVIHDWEENQGAGFRKRAAAADRKRRQRGRDERSDVTPERDSVTPARDIVTQKREDMTRRDGHDETDKTGREGHDETGRDPSSFSTGQGEGEAVDNLCRSPLWSLSLPQTATLVAEIAAEFRDVDLVRETQAFLSFAADQREPIRSPKKALKGFMARAKPTPGVGPPAAAVEELLGSLVSHMDMDSAPVDDFAGIDFEEPEAVAG